MGRISDAVTLLYIQYSAVGYLCCVLQCWSHSHWMSAEEQRFPSCLLVPAGLTAVYASGRLSISVLICVCFSAHIINTWCRTVCLTTSLSLHSAVRPSALSSFNYCGDAESHSGLTFFFVSSQTQGHRVLFHEWCHSCHSVLCWNALVW